MLKGRLSRKWGIMQELFYREHPDFRHSKTKTGLGWTIRMIKELTGMMLDMWASRCGCLHGHSKAEKKQKKKEEIGRTVRKCYGRRSEVVVEHQDIFDQPVDEMVRIISSHYLRAWVNMFYSLVLLSDRIRERKDSQEACDEDSVMTYDTMDLAEYLVDATDGMDREWDIGDAGVVLTPPTTEEGEVAKTMVGAPRCKVKNPY